MYTFYLENYARAGQIGDEGKMEGKANKLIRILRMDTWTVVVAQLVERLLLIPKVCGSNPVIGKNLFIY